MTDWSNAIELHPTITGPYEYDKATRSMRIGIIGCDHGPAVLLLDKPGETARQILAAIESVEDPAEPVTE
jgi:hypothetical protein